MQNNHKSWLIGILGLIVGAGATFVLVRSTAPPSKEQAGQHTISTAAKEETWTCAMHPSVRQGEPGDCPICGMALTPATENDNNDPLVLQMTEAAVQLANIQTTTVGSANRTDPGHQLRLAGKVQADERLASSQVAQLSGRIEKLYVSFTGEQVDVGQKLADLYAPDFITAQRELLEASKLATSNPSLIEAARTKLRYWKVSSETIAAIERSGQPQETLGVYATEAGVVSKRRVSVGDYVRQGEPLFDLMGLQRVWVQFDAYEEDLPKLSMGTKITFRTPALPGQTFSAPITFIDPVVDPQTRVVSLRAELNNSRRQLKPEMLVTGTVETPRQQKAALSVPKSAVLWTGPRSVVYVKIPGAEVPSFQFREINLGDAIGNRYEVLAGLEAGEEIVTHGSFVIDAAAQLNNQASMINQNVAVKQASEAILIPDFAASVNANFQEQLGRVVTTYLALKDALIATDAAAAAQQASDLYESVVQMEGQLLEGDAQAYWQEQRSGLEAHSQKISELNEVEAQRRQFDFLSQVIVETVKAFGIKEQQYYVQFCPMAINDQGAVWLSAEDQVRNPYFGDVMLRCGVVQETIPATQ